MILEQSVEDIQSGRILSMVSLPFRPDKGGRDADLESPKLQQSANNPNLVLIGTSLTI